MENQLILSVEGQEITKGEVNTLGRNGGLADDRLLWEFLRMRPGNEDVQKAILPFEYADAGPMGGLSSAALVHGGLANGKVRVMPFRALLSSQSTDTQTEKLRAVRSGYLFGPDDFFVPLTITANPSADPRWTLVYALVTPDSLVDPVPEYVKDPDTATVSQVSVSLEINCTVSLQTVDGTPDASPTRPALPADAGGVYYIPIAYIWVQDGFGALSSISRGQIHEVFPTVTLTSNVGAAVLRPADQQYAVDGSVDTNQDGTAGPQRPRAYLPPGMGGVEERILVLQFLDPPNSHEDGDVVDTSIDWRFRFFDVWGYCGYGAGDPDDFGLASDRRCSDPNPGSLQTPSAFLSNPGESFWRNMGQSFVDDTTPLNGFFTAPVTDGNGVVTRIDSSQVTNLVAGTLALYVRNTDGALVIKTDTMTSQVFIWLRASGPYANFGTV